MKKPRKASAAWKAPASLQRLENPCADPTWAAEPAWNKLALLARAWRLIANELGSKKGQRR